jgi:hypothetical protein
VSCAEAGVAIAIAIRLAPSRWHFGSEIDLILLSQYAGLLLWEQIEKNAENVNQNCAD